MWARIEDNKVQEITDIDPEGRFHESMKWVKFDGRKNVQTGWRYDGSDFSEPEIEPTAEGAASFTYKTDIWQRATNEEADKLDSELSAATAKERRMWDDALTIEHDSEYFTALRDKMVTQFGEDRTNEILSPSN